MNPEEFLKLLKENPELKKVLLEQLRKELENPETQVEKEVIVLAEGEKFYYLFDNDFFVANKERTKVKLEPGKVYRIIAKNKDIYLDILSAEEIGEIDTSKIIYDNLTKPKEKISIFPVMGGRSNVYLNPADLEDGIYISIINLSKSGKTAYLKDPVKLKAL